jgi:hypothetical protein
MRRGFSASGLETLTGFAAREAAEGAACIEDVAENRLASGERENIRKSRRARGAERLLFGDRHPPGGSGCRDGELDA